MIIDRLKLYQTKGLDTKFKMCGKLTRVIGITLEAVGVNVPLGSICNIATASGDIEAEVIGFDENKVFLML